MKKILSGIVIVLLSFSAMADHHAKENADLHAAIKAFDDAYSNNDVEAYFGFYADVAIATSFIDNRTRSPDGSKDTSRAFETDVWQKIDGNWQIISLHYSVIPPAE